MTHISDMMPSHNCSINIILHTVYKLSINVVLFCHAYHTLPMINSSKPITLPSYLVHPYRLPHDPHPSYDAFRKLFDLFTLSCHSYITHPNGTLNAYPSLRSTIYHTILYSSHYPGSHYPFIFNICPHKSTTLTQSNCI